MAVRANSVRSEGEEDGLYADGTARSDTRHA